mmetsp:Transcript_114082/g.317586  ORF Transcript_114082/g.317586 Transcript_114082/m.317586 type:complete len:237 (+) Transcript_114082:682-1392(+)
MRGTSSSSPSSSASRSAGSRRSATATDRCTPPATSPTCPWHPPAGPRPAARPCARRCGPMQGTATSGCMLSKQSWVMKCRQSSARCAPAGSSSTVPQPATRRPAGDGACQPLALPGEAPPVPGGRRCAASPAAAAPAQRHPRSLRKGPPPPQLARKTPGAHATSRTRTRLRAKARARQWTAAAAATPPREKRTIEPRGGRACTRGHAPSPRATAGAAGAATRAAPPAPVSPPRGAW